jgi:hypothetical protein
MSLVARQVTGQKDERRFDWQEPQCKKHLCDSWPFRVCCWGFEHMRCLGGRQNDPRPPDVLLRAVPIRDDRFQSGTVRGAYLDGDTFAHPSRLAQRESNGNPSLDFIH